MATPQTNGTKMGVMYIIFRQDDETAIAEQTIETRTEGSFLLRAVPLRTRLNSPFDLVLFALLLRHFHILSL